MLSGQLTEEGSMRRAHTLRLAGPLAVTLPYKAIEDVMKVKGIKQGSSAGSRITLPWIEPPSRMRGEKGGTMMRGALLCGVGALLLATAAMAGQVNTYQVTGPVLEVKDDMIAVQKGKDRWDLARDKDTKVTGDLKVGSKVTIQYRMTATSIEATEAKSAKTKK
jgi:hypothetical protein